MRWLFKYTCDTKQQATVRHQIPYAPPVTSTSKQPNKHLKHEALMILKLQRKGHSTYTKLFGQKDSSTQEIIYIVSTLKFARRASQFTKHSNETSLHCSTYLCACLQLYTLSCTLCSASHTLSLPCARLFHCWCLQLFRLQPLYME